MTAFVDESMRLGAGGLYVVAAVVVAEDVDLARQTARSVLVRRQPRFHWRNESEARRQVMLELIRGLDIEARVYVREPIAPRRQAGARALCLNALLWDLWQAGIDDFVLESRQAHADGADRRTILAAQRARRASPNLAYRFARAIEEPLLWLADALAGGASAQIADGADYLDTLGGIVTRHDVTGWARRCPGSRQFRRCTRASLPEAYRPRRDPLYPLRGQLRTPVPRRSRLSKR